MDDGHVYLTPPLSTAIAALTDFNQRPTSYYKKIILLIHKQFLMIILRQEI